MTYNRGWLLIALRKIAGGPIEDDLRHKSIRLLQGFKGDLGRGVSYDASYLLAKSASTGNISTTSRSRASAGRSMSSRTPRRASPFAARC